MGKCNACEGLEEQDYLCCGCDRVVNNQINDTKWNWRANRYEEIENASKYRRREQMRNRFRENGKEKKHEETQ